MGVPLSPEICSKNGCMI
uniref:Uncharacterized protein n=1 Tax=Oryza barthii TaxID=65489 RepID=A0A0D3F2X6_9ORYZ